MRLYGRQVTRILPAFAEGCRNVGEELWGILYKAESEDISDKPDATKDAQICCREIILENFSINEKYKDELKNDSPSHRL